MSKRLSIDQIVGEQWEAINALITTRLNSVWTNIPAKVTKYDAKQRTVDVQPVIQDVVYTEDNTAELETLPVLKDVPVVFPSAGKFEITFPIEVGDDCVVMISKQCIDYWWKYGGVQPPFELRKFDLSDTFAFFKPHNQKRIENLDEWDTTNFRIQTEDQKCYIEITPEKTINAKNEKVSISIDNEGNITLTQEKDMTLNVKGNVIANITGNVTTSIDGDMTATIKGKMSADITGDASITTKGKASIDATAGCDIVSKAMAKIEAIGPLTVDAAMIDIKGKTMVTVAVGGSNIQVMPGMVIVNKMLTVAG